MDVLQPLLLKPTWHRVSAEGRSASAQLFCGDLELTLAAELSATSPGAPEAPWKFSSSPAFISAEGKEVLAASQPDNRPIAVSCFCCFCHGAAALGNTALNFQLSLLLFHNNPTIYIYITHTYLFMCLLNLYLRTADSQLLIHLAFPFRALD